MKKLRAVLCALVGHSRMATCFFGYQYCARCGAQVGDALAGVTVDALLVGDSAHSPDQSCDVCDRMRESLTWRDTLLTPYTP